MIVTNFANIIKKATYVTQSDSFDFKIATFTYRRMLNDIARVRVVKFAHFPQSTKEALRRKSGTTLRPSEYLSLETRSESS